MENTGTMGEMRLGEMREFTRLGYGDEQHTLREGAKHSQGGPGDWQQNRSPAHSGSADRLSDWPCRLGKAPRTGTL